jgi:hypothetical protein
MGEIIFEDFAADFDYVAKEPCDSARKRLARLDPHRLNKSDENANQNVDGIVDNFFGWHGKVLFLDDRLQTCPTGRQVTNLNFEKAKSWKSVPRGIFSGLPV